MNPSSGFTNSSGLPGSSGFMPAMLPMSYQMYVQHMQYMHQVQHMQHLQIVQSLPVVPQMVSKSIETQTEESTEQVQESDSIPKSKTIAEINTVNLLCASGKYTHPILNMECKSFVRFIATKNDGKVTSYLTFEDNFLCVVFETNKDMISTVKNATSGNEDAKKKILEDINSQIVSPDYLISNLQSLIIGTAYNTIEIPIAQVFLMCPKMTIEIKKNCDYFTVKCEQSTLKSIKCTFSDEFLEVVNNPYSLQQYMDKLVAPLDVSNFDILSQFEDK